jgi:hypothetical protein
MGIFAISRDTVSVATAAGLLAACNGIQPLVGAPNVISAAQSHHQTFDYTGKEQTFKVPAGVKLITVDALGAAGGGNYSGLQGGMGGRTTAELPVTPGESLALFVGGSTNGASGGYNGGGEGVSFTFSGYPFTSYGGGGATDIRESGTALKDRILVAGGGGGLGSVVQNNDGGDGGLGGGKVAGNGANGAGSKRGGRRYHHCHFFGGGGGGGAQHDGGKAGRKSCLEPGGTAGAFGDGGNGGEGSSGAGGGGGGGGYYGGGGGGGGDNYGGGGGGGGGSSYAEPRATSVHMRRGWETGNGLVVISW